MAKFTRLPRLLSQKSVINLNSVVIEKPRNRGRASARTGFSRFWKKIRNFRFYSSHLAVEFLLLAIMIFTVAVNIFLRNNFAKASESNRSLFFDYLKDNAHYNEQLVDAYESVSLKLSGRVNLTEQILASSTKEKESANPSPAPPLPTLSGSALLKPNPATSSGLAPKQDIEVYEVKTGDTVAEIAASHGISIQTVLGENNLSDASVIRPGQKLTILPTTGVRHVIKQGETISEIATKYSVDDAEVLEYNGYESEDLIFVGEELIIPNGTKKQPATPQRQQHLADLKKEDYQKVDVASDYQGSGSGLAWPLPGTGRISQYASRRHMALDIPCRDCQVVSAADGIVEQAGWKKGYGNMALVNHGNGIKTLYAHGKSLSVSAGDAVSQGQTIMISGNTGNSSGPHLHFEVKINGQLTNPLQSVKP